MHVAAACRPLIATGGGFRHRVPSQRPVRFTQRDERDRDRRPAPRPPSPAAAATPAAPAPAASSRADRARRARRPGRPGWLRAPDDVEGVAADVEQCRRGDQCRHRVAIRAARPPTSAIAPMRTAAVARLMTSAHSGHPPSPRGRAARTRRRTRARRPRRGRGRGRDAFTRRAAGGDRGQAGHPRRASWRARGRRPQQAPTSSGIATEPTPESAATSPIAPMASPTYSAARPTPPATPAASANEQAIRPGSGGRRRRGTTTSAPGQRPAPRPATARPPARREARPPAKSPTPKLPRHEARPDEAFRVLRCIGSEPSSRARTAGRPLSRGSVTRRDRRADCRHPAGCRARNRLDIGRGEPAAVPNRSDACSEPPERAARVPAAPRNTWPSNR